MITGLTLKTFAKHLTSEGFSKFPVVYWAKVSEPAGKARCAVSENMRYSIDSRTMDYNPW